MPILTPATSKHVFLDTSGVAWIDDTHTKVVEVIRDHAAGYTPEQLREEYPHLTRTQVYAAISYYYLNPGFAMDTQASAFS